ncbi:MAG: hypothetical protein IBX68_10210 [Dehalococcoidia bacterium]|nr:hypothetical protein [Dehalococcoidia bacterium]
MNRFARVLGLVGMVIVLVIGIPLTATAQEVPEGLKEVSDLKQQLISLLPENENVDAHHAEKAEEARRNAEAAMQEAIAVPDHSSVRYRTQVHLGTDAIFYTADGGNADAGRWGATPGAWGADYYAGMRRAEAASLVGPGGWGGAWAWANVGKFFTVVGEGSRVADLRVIGDLNGYLSVLVAGSTSVTVKFVLYNYTTGTSYETVILNQSLGLAGYSHWTHGFNQGIPVLLQAGHDYIAYIQVETASGVYGVGYACSDWGRQDGDYGQYIQYSSISINF